MPGKASEKASEKASGSARFVVLFLVLFLLALACAAAASADDPELTRILPGAWTLTDEVQEDGEETRTADLAVLTLAEDGKLTFACHDKDGKYLWTCEGTWSLEILPDALDRVTLLFTATDNPAHASGAYRAERVYTAYSESWVEDDIFHQYLILEEAGGEGAAPFEELTGYNSAAVHREQGPNMRVVNCSNYVSLRAKRSASSARLAKVPLGSLVLAFPESGEENGFLLCVWQDEYGYIRSEYLEPAE
jgi:hypothetical protein